MAKSIVKEIQIPSTSADEKEEEGEEEEDEEGTKEEGGRTEDADG